MKSYLLSTLRQTFSQDEFIGFARSNASHWLLWEPGAWTPPPRQGDTLSLDEMELHPGKAGEALALVLAPKRLPGDQVTLGRGADCDLPLNDGTLSQTHLVFMYAAGGWTVRDAGSTNGSWVNGQRVPAGEPVKLHNGSRIQAAQVQLTHYEPEGLWERLELIRADRAR